MKREGKREGKGKGMGKGKRKGKARGKAKGRQGKREGKGKWREGLIFFPKERLDFLGKKSCREEGKGKGKGDPPCNPPPSRR